MLQLRARKVAEPARPLYVPRLVSRTVPPLRSPLVLAIIPFILIFLGPACASSGTFRDGVYYGREAAYRVAELPSPWRQVSFADNDLAWIAPEGQVIAVNGLCAQHGDPSLKVLTDHLLLGFEGREVRAREELKLAGRAALRTRAAATLDGVPVELELTVVKKDGCVYDLTYSAPPAGFDGRVAAYRKLVEGFEAGGSHR